MKELSKAFEHKDIEKKWLKSWLDAKIFEAKSDSKKDPYVIIMPPPNVTGALHNGHALFVTLQDILARYHRMKGFDVLWLPGTDHAGIATQTVVERELLKKEGLTKHDLGRTEFLKKVFAWKDVHGDKIIEQLKMLGASADWSRLKFTMDEDCSKAVTYAFVKLWNDGLIYRKERLISWDPKTKTALSNEEVDHVEQNTNLVYFAYKLKEDAKKEIVVATTRLETMLGDVAVAVNPKDDRYKDLVGKELLHPFFPDRSVVVVADDYVDPDFGSGAVKITPAHDPNDFLIGERHNLPKITILDLEGRINEHGGEYQGLGKLEARKKIEQKLMELELFRKKDSLKHKVSISQRSGEVIEPMLSRQYFVNAKPLAKMAYEAVKNGETTITPSSFTKIWNHFLLNIQDWCISRQLWWGHRIPVYYHIESLKSAVRKQGKLSLKALDNNEPIKNVLRFALEELSEESIRAFSFASEDNPGEEYLQEEDVLDTWFSSGLWPFSTLGWPNKTADLARYYPSNVLETGFDILFFWVARMVMFGCYFMGKTPFKDVFLHSMVRDSHGKKMSKSLGNAIDPKDVIDGISLEDLLNKTKTYPVHKDHLPKVLNGLKKDFPEGIPESGADGLRLSLAIFSGQGQDVKFSVPRVIGYRGFLNKVWNATRFAMLNIDEVKPLAEVKDHFSLADKYILSRLSKTVKAVSEEIESYKFSEAAQNLYHFFWDEYCSTYIECAKKSFSDQASKEEKIATSSVLVHLLDTSMRLLHPFCPFISEEIFSKLSTLKSTSQEFLATSPFPNDHKEFIDDCVEEDMAQVLMATNMVRNLRQESNVSANHFVSVVILAKNASVKKAICEQSTLIKHLAKASDIKVCLRQEQELAKTFAVHSSGDFDVAIDLLGLIDFDAEKKRIETALKKLVVEKDKLTQKLSNKNFKDKAPKEVLAKFEEQLTALNNKEDQLKKAHLRFS